MGKNPSLKYQMLQKIDSLKRFGQSKHEAKMLEKARCAAVGEKWNPARVPGIYSHVTADTYKQHALDFSSWVRENHGVRNLDQIQREHVGQWLQQSIDQGKSAWTVKAQAAAMAKVLDCRTTDFGVETPGRHRRDIERSRGERAHDKHFSERNNSSLVNFARGCGLRRHELAALRPDQIQRDTDGKVVLKDVQGKGGRFRDVPVTGKYQDHVWRMKEQAENTGKQVVFEHVPNRADIHSYRREYCNERYREIAEIRQPSGETYMRRDDKQVFDREVLRVVSENMGHSREDVIVRHYLD